MCNQFDLSLKRGYKVCSVLSDLGLVQIYDRPMKIHIATPIMILWQNLIQKRIEDLRFQFHEKRDKCESALEDFTKKYRLDEQLIQEPVEFINYDIRNFDESYPHFLAQSECRIAIGIRYDNPLNSMIHEDRYRDLAEETKISMSAGMNRIKDNLININVKVIFNSEVAKDLLMSKQFELFTNHVEPYSIEFKKIEIHVTDEAFSNFSLTNNEIIQPSFDPTNILIGTYISRNKNIYQIFHHKFTEIFENGSPISNFLIEHKDIGIERLSETQMFVLCVM